MKHIFRPILALILMALCAVAGLAIPLLWHAPSGRDFRLQGGIAAVLILLLGAVLRRIRRWAVIDCLVAFVALEVLMLALIARQSGFTGSELFHWFNLSWLGSLTLFTGLPWLLGLLLGSLWPQRATHS